MKSITIHNLDEQLAGLIKEKARLEGSSINSVLKKLLRKALSIDPNLDEGHMNEFKDLFGVWTEKDAAEFNAKVKDLERIDPGDWA